MRRQLSRTQWDRVAEKLMELGNLIFIGLVVTQAVSGVAFNPRIASIGSITIIISYVIAYLLMRKGGGK